jgi:hypothetical protein
LAFSAPRAKSEARPLSGPHDYLSADVPTCSFHFFPLQGQCQSLRAIIRVFATAAPATHLRCAQKLDEKI